MNGQITWHGHSCFQIAGNGVNLLIDPFFTGNPKAVKTPEKITAPDVVLVTHTHSDHVGDAAAICIHTGALLATAVGMGEELIKAGVPEAQVLNGQGFNIGGSMQAKGVTITMTQAFHTINGVSPVGFIITMPNGYVIYHAGDTGIFGSMAILGELYPIDLALLPAGGVFTMDIRQAAMAVKLLQAKNVIPMHWGTFPMLAQSMDGFAEAVARTAPKCGVTLMKPGETTLLP